MQLTNDPSPTLKETEGDLTFLYFVSRHSEGPGFMCAVEVHQHGAVCCKLVSLRPHDTEQQALDSMRERSRAWVNDWSARRPTVGV